MMRLTAGWMMAGAMALAAVGCGIGPVESDLDSALDEDENAALDDLEVVGPDVGPLLSPGDNLTPAAPHAAVAAKPQPGAPPGDSSCDSAADCDDSNDCTNDACEEGVCAHNAFDHLHTCGGGAGKCDGNIPACCTTNSLECCKGCKSFANGVWTCVDQCPNGAYCSPITVQCAQN
jgi:hypothetical protein